jgi:hypothetical protein
VITEDKVVQILRAELLRPVRVHLRTGQKFVVRGTDYVLEGCHGFIISRPQPKGAPMYVETVRSSDVVALDLMLNWRLYVTP